MAKHKHGSMKIDEQHKTFAGFIKATIYSSIAIIAALVFLAIFNS